MAEIKEDPQICIKIMVYDKCHVDEVVYYRNKLPMWIVEQWRWYFEYLAARIKVAHPRRKVELVICAQTLLQGEEYIQAKTAAIKPKKTLWPVLVAIPVMIAAIAKTVAIEHWIAFEKVTCFIIGVAFK